MPPPATHRFSPRAPGPVGFIHSALRRIPRWGVSLAAHTLALILFVLGFSAQPQPIDTPPVPPIVFIAEEAYRLSQPDEVADDGSFFNADDRYLFMSPDIELVPVLDPDHTDTGAGDGPIPSAAHIEEVRDEDASGLWWEMHPQSVVQLYHGDAATKTFTDLPGSDWSEIHQYNASCRLPLPVSPPRAAGTPPPDRDSVAESLAWLARHQEPDGHWDTVKLGADKSARCDTAATGLALQAFIGGGVSDRRGQYKDTVKRAATWLIAQQQANGLIQPGANGPEIGNGPGFHHAIAGLALAELYAYSHSDWLQAPAQKALDYSLNIHQHRDPQTGEFCGWGYRPDSEPDMAVSLWFIMQLKSSRLANLAFPPDAFAGAIAFLDARELPPPADQPNLHHRYGYSASRPAATPMCTLMGCAARVFLGWPKEELEPALTAFLKPSQLPIAVDHGDRIDWLQIHLSIFVYYQIGGENWRAWNNALVDPHTLIIELQFDPDAGDNAGAWPATGQYASLGKVFSTSLACQTWYLCTHPPCCPLYQRPPLDHGAADQPERQK